MSGNLTVTLGGSLELLLRPAPPAIIAVVTVIYQQFTVTVKGSSAMAYTLPSGMQVTAKITYVDASGNPAAVDGPVSWLSSDPTICTVDVDSTDSTLCTIAAIGPVGSAQITASADADLGSGVTSLVTLADFTVVAGEAVAGTITIEGSPVPIPPA